MDIVSRTLHLHCLTRYAVLSNCIPPRMFQKLVVLKLVSILISGVIVNWSGAKFRDWWYNIPYHTLSSQNEVILSYFHQDNNIYIAQPVVSTNLIMTWLQQHTFLHGLLDNMFILCNEKVLNSSNLQFLDGSMCWLVPWRR